MAKRRQNKKQGAELETELKLEDAFVYAFSCHRDPLLYPDEGDASGSAFGIPNVKHVTGSPQNTVVERQGDQPGVANVATFDSADVTMTASGPVGRMLMAMMAGEPLERVTDVVREGMGDVNALAFEAYVRTVSKANEADNGKTG